ncbi:MAG: hypothetical protein QUU85_14260, partial [Candidatus Eisenbacteria bacterium]|nr:hypothetical protein [Candidatus Eisenbacteria bacterium]
MLPIRRPLLALALLALALALAGGAFLAGRRLLRRMEIEPFRSDVALSAPFSGTLRVSAFAGGAGDARGGARSVLSQRHVFTFVDGPTYSGMEDNDLRGFLDGTYKHAWNQARQVHVRVGRRDGSEAYGEYELFRVVQRWEGIELPPGAIVTRGTLTIGVESSPADSVRLVLYEMKRDYRTGGGGTLGDNVSPPRPGEVWWNDAAFGEEAWALPGAGYASDTDRQADTGAMPLADAVYVPGASRVIFDSAGLASCATRRIAAGRPLLFLLKVGDVEEDTPGSVVTLYSANEGDSRNVARRPRLELEWEAPGEIARLEQA